MTQQENYKILDETEVLTLGHFHEDTYLIIKATKEKISLGSVYGDPTCGLIDRANDWCIVGGSLLLIWAKGKIISIEDDDIHGIYDIRQTGAQKIELLIDPWAGNSAIWEFDILENKKRKIKDFPFYRYKEYTEQVVW